MSQISINQTGEHFDPTPWTWIRSLQNKSSPEEAVKQLERLSKRYWPCVYAYLRRQGRNPQAAADITQSFFADVLLGRGLFERVDQQSGRFRDVLAQSVRRYNIDWARRESVLGRRLLRLDDELPGIESQLQDRCTLTPEEEFNRRWASRTLFEAVQRCEQHFQQADKDQHWQIYRRRVLHPTLYGTKRPSYFELCQEFEFEKTQHAANAVFAVNQKFRRFLREVINETVSYDDRVAQQEYEYLFAMFTPNSSDHAAMRNDLRFNK